jgi:hypothetical protein
MILEFTELILDAFELAIQVIKNAGAIIVDNTNFSAFDLNAGVQADFEN